MTFINSDVKDMLEVFQTESLELMDHMESYLMEAEKNQLLSADLLQGIFRIVHTMKSSSAMMGLEAMSSCSHRLEDLFLIYREDPSKAAKATTQIFDLLYAYVDYIRSEMGQIAEPDYEPGSTGQLLRRIGDELQKVRLEDGASTVLPSALNSGAKTSPADPAQAQPAEATDQICQWQIFLQDDLQMENVRAFLILKQLQPLCSFLESTPADLQTAGAASQIQAHGLLIRFASSSPEQVYQKLVSSVYVKELKDLSSATPAAQGGSGEKAEKKKEKASKTGTVAWQKILSLQNITGELLTLSNMLERKVSETAHSDQLEDLVIRNRQLLNELENVVNSVSLTPISGMVHQYNRAIRDICKKEKKEILFQVQGEDLEVDKTLIDSLTNPLLHMIRNAADHGIESQAEREQAGKPAAGKILFSVIATGENLYFSVSDDGRGLNTEQILDKAEASGLLNRPREAYNEEEAQQLIFRAGFSTSRQVTEYSGRGVGLDVVQKAADSLRGSVYVESHFGEGTTVTVSVPASLTSVDSIQFCLGAHSFFIPTKNIEQIQNYGQSKTQLTWVDGREYLHSQGNLIPLIRLRLAYGLPPADESALSGAFILIVKGIKHRMAFVADQITGQSTIVEKALPELIPREYRKHTGINGCAVTADGSIGFILNADWIMRAYERGDLYGETTSRHAGA